MEICFTINGKTHCFYLPIYRFPIPVPIGDPWKNKEGLLFDVALLGSMYAEASKISDAAVREALVAGFGNALALAKKNAGPEFAFSFRG